MARRQRRRAAKEAAGETAADVVRSDVVLRIGSALWYLLLLPLRLLLRLLDY